MPPPSSAKCHQVCKCARPSSVQVGEGGCKGGCVCVGAPRSASRAPPRPRTPPRSRAPPPPRSRPSRPSHLGHVDSLELASSHLGQVLAVYLQTREEGCGSVGGYARVCVGVCGSVWECVGACGRRCVGVHLGLWAQSGDLRARRYGRRSGRRPRATRRSPRPAHTPLWMPNLGVLRGPT